MIVQIIDIKDTLIFESENDPVIPGDPYRPEPFETPTQCMNLYPGMAFSGSNVLAVSSDSRMRAILFICSRGSLVGSPFSQNNRNPLCAIDSIIQR